MWHIVYGIDLLVWAPLIIWLIVCFWAVEFWDSGIVAGWVTLVFLVVLWFAGDIDVSWLRSHAWDILFGIIGYAVIAPFWGIIKWSFFLKDKLREYEGRREALLRESDTRKMIGASLSTPVGAAPVYPEGQDFLARLIQQRMGGSFPPSPTTHKRAILAWMTWWPFSLVGTICDEPIRRFFLWVYDLLDGLLQRMSDRMFAKYAHELRAPTQPTTPPPPIRVTKDG